MTPRIVVAAEPDFEPDYSPPSYRTVRPYDEPTESEIEADDDDAESADFVCLWRDRLVFDPEVSTRSPVVKGTWITVNHVVSLIVDGWAWADILKTHPELTEDDIRACVAYTVEEDGPNSAA